MSPEAVGPPPNVVSRVISLPLVSSTYGMVSSVYIHSKENHPYLRSLCEVAEKGVLTLTAVAMTRAMPIIQRMEPQIAVANNYACMGLDKIEEKLPILHQPPDKIFSRALEIVTGAKDTLTAKVTNARELVRRTREAAQKRIKKTKAVFCGGINRILGNNVVQVVNKGVDTALTKSENLIDHYLPLTADELAKESAKEGFEVVGQKPNYSDRLGSMSSKVRRRAFQQAVSRLRDVASKSLNVVTQLHATIDVDLEARTLAVACNLRMHLETTCFSLVSNLPGLRHNLHEQARHKAVTAIDLCQNFHLVSSFGELSDNVLGSTKRQLDRINCMLDNVVDNIVDYVNVLPLNWLVGPLYSQLVG